ncbi:MAG TPA: hypothetical protein VNO34_07265 [Actinomycetota bacterium]|nr:hypothetical protein [Actinomycetota bacterium]
MDVGTSLVYSWSGREGLGLVAAGVRAVVVCLDPRALPASFCGRDYDRRFLDELPDGVDPCGERGEFHTFVRAGPPSRAPVPCRRGEVVVRDEFVSCDLRAVGTGAPLQGEGEAEGGRSGAAGTRRGGR